MSPIVPQTPDAAAQLQRRQALTGILEYTVASLELTQDQRTSVENEYKDCGIHLAKALGYDAARADIFPQGSMSLGTVIRPLRGITEAFDLDVVFRVIAPANANNPQVFRDQVGEHLAKKYKGVVKPLAKGWRLDFEKERDYYLDVIPAMDSEKGGGVIAITDAYAWKDSHPRGYATWFEERARVMPKLEAFSAVNEGRAVMNSAKIEPLPEHTDFKYPLQRITQISKRYRDYFFNKKRPSVGEFVTPSIVATTLLANAYGRLVSHRPFQSGYDLLLACVEGMPDSLRVTVSSAGKFEYALLNPSLPTENLVKKWTDDNRYAEAFYAWHKDYLAFLRALVTSGEGQRAMLTEALGQKAVGSAFQRQQDILNAARNSRLLRAAPAVGLGVTAGATVPGHVIHGRKR